jgi:hypothetical protein
VQAAAAACHLVDQQERSSNKELGAKKNHEREEGTAIGEGEVASREKRIFPERPRVAAKRIKISQSGAIEKCEACKSRKYNRPTTNK